MLNEELGGGHALTPGDIEAEVRMSDGGARRCKSRALAFCALAAAVGVGAYVGYLLFVMNWRGEAAPGGEAQHITPAVHANSTPVYLGESPPCSRTRTPPKPPHRAHHRRQGTGASGSGSTRT